MIGRSEQAILLVLQSLGGREVTTTDVFEILHSKSRLVTVGGVYVAIDRLVKKKFVARRRGEPLPERGGKARFYYKITNSGRAALIHAHEASAVVLSLSDVVPKRG